MVVDADDLRTLERWTYLDVLDAWTWTTFRTIEGETEPQVEPVFGWRWFEDRDNFTEGWVDVLPTGYFRGLKYWDLSPPPPQVVRLTYRWVWMHPEWVKAPFNRREDGSVEDHPVAGAADWADYHISAHGMCELYWDEESWQWCQKGCWMSLGGDAWVPLPDDSEEVDSDADLDTFVFGREAVLTWERENLGDLHRLLAAAKSVREMPWRPVLRFLYPAGFALPANLECLLSL
jgi:hypothetical protein